VHHLRRLSLHQRDMLVFAARLVEVVLDQPPEEPLLIAVLHREQVVAGGDKIVGDVRLGRVTIHIALLIE
jgi:hypothetical protein